MSGKVEWLVPNAVIYQKFDADHTVEDIHAANEKLLKMLDSSDRVLVHYVMDLTTLSGLPKHIREVIQASKPFFDHPKLGWSVSYGTQNAFFKMVGQVLAGVFKLRFRMFEHEHEALQFLTQVDKSLPELPPVQEVVA